MSERRSGSLSTMLSITICLICLIVAGCGVAATGFSIDSVSPSELASGRTATLLVRGRGFQQGDTIRVGSAQLVSTVWVNAQVLSASLPKTLPAANYDVAVTHRDGRETLMADALRIEGPAAAKPSSPSATAATPPPVVASMSKAATRTPAPSATTSPTLTPRRRISTPISVPSTTPSPIAQRTAPATAQLAASFPVLASVVKAFYTDLGSRHFTDAYALLSPAFQARHPYQSWLEGYANTDGFSVEIDSTTTPNTVFVRIVSTDLSPTGAPAQHSFSGTWTLIQTAQGGWLLDRGAIFPN